MCVQRNTVAAPEGLKILSNRSEIIEYQPVLYPDVTSFLKPGAGSVIRVYGARIDAFVYS